MFSLRNILGLGGAAVATAAALFLLTQRSFSEEKISGQTHVVHIQGMVFTPAKVTIAPGDAVTWINDDILLHAVKSADPKNAWQSKDLPSHASWSKKFADGASYLCPYHPTMTGTIVVEEAKSVPAGY